MKLAPMRYKGFTWPHNPRVYTIDFSRSIAVHKVPYGLYHLQDLGRTQREMRGEGEFVGPGAYEQFGRLANAFYETGPGPLIHPLWQAAQAHFVQLRVEQEPQADYVRYSFVFWEAAPQQGGGVAALSPPAAVPQVQEGQVGDRRYTVVRGDTLWAIAQRHRTSIQRLLELNPGIKNPNLIRVGQEVLVG